MMWDAIGADYQRIAEKGRALRDMLEAAKSVHVTSPGGTDVTFAVEGRQAFVDDGVMTAEKAKGKKFVARDIALPGGTVVIAPLETSATGRVVAPRVQCRFLTMTGVTFEFKDGKMEGLKATKGLPCLTELIANSGGPTDVIGAFSIGLNPGLKIHEERNAAYYGGGKSPGDVDLPIGPNQSLAGTNKSSRRLGVACPLQEA